MPSNDINVEPNEEQQTSRKFHGGVSPSSGASLPFREGATTTQNAYRTSPRQARRQYSPISAQSPDPVGREQVAGGMTSRCLRGGPLRLQIEVTNSPANHNVPLPLGSGLNLLQLRKPNVRKHAHHTHPAGLPRPFN